MSDHRIPGLDCKEICRRAVPKSTPRGPLPLFYHKDNSSHQEMKDVDRDGNSASQDGIFLNTYAKTCRRLVAYCKSEYSGHDPHH